MSKLSRRQLLIFFGSSAAATVLAPVASQKFLGGGDPNAAQAIESLSFTPLRLAHPLEIYQATRSYLPSGIGQGNTLDPSANVELSSYTYLDDVVVPPEYERYVIVSWGDRVFPNSDEYFGYNNDYTGYVPIQGTNEGYLFVNHEYVSFPISFLAPEAPADVVGLPTSDLPVLGFSLPSAPSLSGLSAADRRLLYGEFFYNVGASIVRIKKTNGKYAPIVDAKNRRIHGLSGLGLNSTRTDGYQTVTSWGSKSYQQGDNKYLIGTGPAASEVFNLSSDGLGNKIIGTAYNCSGGTTPWGRVLSAEENFQGGAGAFFVGVQEEVRPNGTQLGYINGTTGGEFGLVGEKYGWMVEVDPADPNYRPRKHTWLGRFRHENIALRIRSGRQLVAYLGDDRRGGHTWKFVSKNRVTSPTDKNNSRLFEEGVLYVAKFNPPSTPGGNSGTGEWIPLLLSTSTNPVSPADLGAGTRSGSTRTPFIRLPRRAGLANQTIDGGGVSISNPALLSDYAGKKLSDFYSSQGAVLTDAYLAGNLVGGTPSARPEDIEVGPNNAVYIAYTDGAPGGDGYPDSRVFVVAKDSSAINDTQQFGGIYKIVEDSEGGVGTRFRWERFAQSGEDGAQPGKGFANVDNLAFDGRGNIWGVTDMSTGLHNGFATGAAGTVLPISHAADVASSTATVVGADTLVGVFGNNWLFYIPTSGPDAGALVPFAYGPPRCEMTGPTFVGDTLILSVQHPSEDSPIDDGTILSRDIEILNLAGTGLFNQQRSVPRGSRWPSNIGYGSAVAPRPSVIGIRRKQALGEGEGQFV